MALLDSTTASGNSATPATAVPAGVGAGTIVVLVASNDGSLADYATADWPAGFTEFAEMALTHDGQSVAAGWKRLTGADSGSYTFGDTGSGAVDWVCQAFAFSGRHATTAPVISTNAVNNTGNASPVTITANGVTAVDGDDLLHVMAPDINTVSAGNGFTAPTNFTIAEQAENSWVNLCGSVRQDVAAGATGTIPGTFALSSGTSGWGAWTIRIPAVDVVAELTGTALAGITEADIVAGGKTIIITLTGDTWIGN